MRKTCYWRFGGRWAASLLVGLTLGGCEAGRIVEFRHDLTHAALEGAPTATPPFDEFRVAGSVIGIITIWTPSRLRLSLLSIGDQEPPNDLSIRSASVIEGGSDVATPLTVVPAMAGRSQSFGPDGVLRLADVEGELRDRVATSPESLTLSVVLVVEGIEYGLEFVLQRLTSWSPPTT